MKSFLVFFLFYRYILQHDVLIPIIYLLFLTPYGKPLCLLSKVKKVRNGQLCRIKSLQTCQSNCRAIVTLCCCQPTPASWPRCFLPPNIIWHVRMQVRPSANMTRDYHSSSKINTTVRVKCVKNHCIKVFTTPQKKNYKDKCI